MVIGDSGLVRGGRERTIGKAGFGRGGIDSGVCGLGDRGAHPAVAAIDLRGIFEGDNARDCGAQRRAAGTGCR